MTVYLDHAATTPILPEAAAAMTARLGMRYLTAYDHPIEGGPSLPSVCYLLTGA